MGGNMINNNSTISNNDLKLIKKCIRKQLYIFE